MSKTSDAIKARVLAGDAETIAATPHGTVTGYATYRCRCVECKTVANAYFTERRHRKGICKPKKTFSSVERLRVLRIAQQDGHVAAAETAGVTTATVANWRHRAQADVTITEALGLLAETDQVRSAMDGRHCPVDGVPLPCRREVTCSKRCAQLWPECLYHLDEAARETHLVRVALWNIEHTDDPVTLRYARKVVRGEPTKDHGRWLCSERQRVLLGEVMDRRAAAKRRWGSLAADLPTPAVLVAEVEAS